MGSLTLAQPNAEIADDLSQFVHADKDGSATFEVAVTGARCANCIAKIEAGVMAIDGVSNVRLNLSTGRLSVAWRGNAVSPQFIIKRVRALGYVAQPYDAATTLDDGAKEGFFLLRCLAVAGFGTVFVMGLTTPSRTPVPAWARTADHVFLACGCGFRAGDTLFRPAVFSSAWASLSNRSTNMDVPISLAIVLSLGLSLYQTPSAARRSISMRQSC